MKRPRLRLPRRPASRSRAAHRRRRAAALILAAAVLAGVALPITAGSGGNSRPPLGLGNGGAVSVITPTGPPAPPAQPAPRFTPAAAAVKLAGALSLPAQVAQLFMVSVNGTTSPGVRSFGSTDWGGAVLTSANFRSDTQVAALVADVGTVRPAGTVPPLIAAAQEGGSQSALPDLPPQGQAVIGASGQPGVAAAQARLAGNRLRALGIQMTLAPLADVDTLGGPLSGRLFGSDPAAVAEFTTAALRGYAAAGVIAAVGHFPGTGGASADPDQMPATVGGTLDQLRARDLIPFAAIAPSAPVIVMSNAAYVAFDAVTPAALLPQAVTLLRRGYAFPGVVMSDDLDAALQATATSAGQVAVQALQAGDELLYISGPDSEHQAAYAAVLAAAQRSAAVRELVHSALLRVLTLKARYGLLR